MSEQASLKDWIEGARPRTLPAALAPVIAGTSLAIFHQAFDIGLALLCLLLALALQIGVNYANDYSDGVRGTDDERVGPLRLVGSGLVPARRVKVAAFASFAVGAVAGLVIIALTGWWWLMIIGSASILAAWYYTGGSRPYGYSGLGEVFVFVFFGLVATTGTAVVQIGISATVLTQAAAASTMIGLLACAILMANNIRDLDGDAAVRKRTLAVRLGDRHARQGYAVMIIGAAVAGLVLAAISTWWAALGLVFLIVGVPAIRVVLRGASGRALIPVLKSTGIAELLASLGLLLGTLVSLLS